MVDKVVSVKRDKIGPPFGRLNDEILVRVNRAMAVWLGMV
jgi:mRNA interferase MazF